MLFSGTMIPTGIARGVVVATGRDTEIGKISGLLQSVETLATPLVRQMNIFARWLTVFILLVAAGLLVFGFVVGHLPFSDLFMVVVGLSVAAIPEGLPAVLTITLAVGVQAMAGRNAIIRRLPAIETIGSVSVVCTDKTGTLTEGKPQVTDLISLESTRQERLPIAKALCQNSNHPLSQAVVTQSHKAKKIELFEFEEISGHGLIGKIS